MNTLNSEYTYDTAEWDANPILTDLEKSKIIKKEYAAAYEFIEWKNPNLSKNEIERKAWDNVKKEEPEILARANRAKHSDIMHQQFLKKKREREIEEYNIKSLANNFNNTKIYFAKMLKHIYGKDFKKESYTQAYLIMIGALCALVSSDNEVAANYPNGYNLKKGILIIGRVGVGKTSAIKCLAGNNWKNINIISMIDVDSNIVDNPNLLMNKNLTQNSLLCLDDVGVENSSFKNYGKEIKPFGSFIHTYYNCPQLWPNLILTTNLTLSAIGEAYGVREIDRINEMFNVIMVLEESKRV